MIVGLTLQTKPEEIYRCLLEAAAFGTRKIIEAFRAGGIEIRRVFACGGLPHRNRLLMQIFADVTGLEIQVPASTQTSGLGAAMLGTLAAGSKGGGCDRLMEATTRMASPPETIYSPHTVYHSIYDKIYREYSELYEEFGRKGTRVMERLKAYKNDLLI